MNARFVIFKGGRFSTDEAIYKKVALFLTKIGPDNLISLTQGLEDGVNTIVVWYWDKKTKTAKERLKTFRQKQ